MRGAFPSRRGAGPALAIALAALGCAATAIAQPPVPDARQIMLKVNAAYAQSFNRPRAIELTQTATTRQAGQPTAFSTATALIYQKGHKARMNSATSAVNNSQLEGPIQPSQVAPAVTRVDWIADGEDLTILEDCSGCPPPGTRDNPIKRLSTAALPGDNPVITVQEFPDVLLEAPFKASLVQRDGQELYLLESTGPVQISLDTKMNLSVLIDPTTWLVVGLESQGQQTVGTATIDLQTVQKVKTRFDVQIDDSVFAVRLPSDAVIKDLSQEALANYKAFHQH